MDSHKPNINPIIKIQQIPKLQDKNTKPVLKTSAVYEEQRKIPDEDMNP